MTPDLAWFRAHPETNFRVRLPEAGEVAELAGLMVAPAGVEIDAPFMPPEGHFWRVLVVKLPLRRVARILTLEEPGKERLPGFVVAPVAFSGRLAVA